MDDAQIPWTSAGVRLDIARVGDALDVVAEPDPAGGPDPRAATEGFGEGRGHRLTGAALESRGGPPVVSPEPAASLGLWLADRLGDASALETWRVVAADGSTFDVSVSGGKGRLICRGLVDRSPASRFRHDAHSLLNAIGMNADLVAMLAGKEALDRIESAAARVRASCDALADLISSRAQSLESGSRLPVTAALGDALRRAGIEGISSGRGDADAAPLLWCLAASRLLIEWVAWLGSAPAPAGVKKGNGDDGRGELSLSCERSAVRLQARIPPSGLAAASSAFRLLPEHPAAPELEAAEPTRLLGGMGVGFGSWQARGAAGVCIGIPAS